LTNTPCISGPPIFVFSSFWRRCCYGCWNAFYWFLNRIFYLLLNNFKVKLLVLDLVVKRLTLKGFFQLVFSYLLEQFSCRSADLLYY